MSAQPASAILSRSPAAEVTQLRGVPGRRALWLLGLGVLPLALVPVWFDVLWLVVGYDLLLVAAMLLDWAAVKRAARLRVRRVREERLSVGADNPVTLVLENHGASTLRVWARDAYPGEFEAAGDDLGTNDEVTLKRPLHRGPARLGPRSGPRRADLDRDADLQAQDEAGRGALGLRRRLARELTPGGATGPGLTLRARARLEVSYALTPHRRGDYRFGDVWLRVESPLGLATLTGTCPLNEPVKVFPNIRGVRALGTLARMRDLHTVGIKRVKREGGGLEFSKLRDYVQGDSYRDINWKATARRRRPITQVYEAERSQSVILCIDASRMMAARMDHLSKLDHAINAALLLAWTALAADDRVGLLVFSDTVRTFLPPARGPAHYQRILNALYGIEPELCHVDYSAAITYLLAHVRRRSLVVLFTDLQDEAHSRPLVDYTRLLMPRHLPLCVTLSDTALSDLRAHVPTTRDALFERAVATELLREREILKGELLRLGAHVIDRTPDALSIDTINAYVDLKRRRL